MNNSSRTEKSIYILSTGIILQAITLIFGFVNRTVFIRSLGMEYLGLNSLFTNILSILSLAELGVGSVITFFMYKPLAEGDNSLLKQIIDFYKIVYRVIGMAILIIGLCLIPFLNHLVSLEQNIDINITIIYVLFLINTVVSYLFFAYRGSIITADQKGYVLNSIELVFVLISNLIEIFILIVFKNYIATLVLRISVSIFKNFAIAYKAQKLYPFLKERKRSKLAKKMLKDIVIKVKSIFIFKLSSQLFYSTDNMIISAIVGTIYVGINANYILITSTVNKILNIIRNSLVAAVGNINAIESTETKYKMFKRLDFLNFWICSFCAVCFYQLLNPFITLWVGEEYLFSQWTVNIIVANFFVPAILNIVFMYRETMGLFEYGKYRQLAAGIVNIILSIILGKFWGVFGIFLATLVSALAIGAFPYPKIVYKYGFNKSSKEYIIRYFMYCGLTVISCLLVKSATIVLGKLTLFTFIGQIILCILIPNILYIFLFRKTDEYKYIKGKVVDLLNKINKKQHVLN